MTVNGWERVVGLGRRTDAGRHAAERARDHGSELPGGRRGSFLVFAWDYQTGEFLPGRTLTLTATFAPVP